MEDISKNSVYTTEDSHDVVNVEVKGVKGFFKKISVRVKSWNWKKILGYFCLLLIACGIGYTGYRFYMFKPYRVFVTNVTSRSATISWITEYEEPGVVLYSKGDSVIPIWVTYHGKNSAFDDRDYSNAELETAEQTQENISESGEITSDQIETEAIVSEVGVYWTHHVTLRNLDPETEYTFWVGDLFVFEKVASVNTGSSTFSTIADVEDVTTPISAYGIARYYDNESDEYIRATDAITYVTLYEEFSGVTSEPISSISNNEGGWYLDLTSAYTSDGESFWDAIANEDSVNVTLQLTEEASWFGRWTKNISYMNSSPADSIDMYNPDEDINIEKDGDLLYEGISYEEENNVSASIIRSLVPNIYAKVVVNEGNRETNTLRYQSKNKTSTSVSLSAFKKTLKAVSEGKTVDNGGNVVESTTTPSTVSTGSCTGDNCSSFDNDSDLEGGTCGTVNNLNCACGTITIRPGQTCKREKNNGVWVYSADGTAVTVDDKVDELPWCSGADTSGDRTCAGKKGTCAYGEGTVTKDGLKCNSSGRWTTEAEYNKWDTTYGTTGKAVDLIKDGKIACTDAVGKVYYSTSCSSESNKVTDKSILCTKAIFVYVQSSDCSGEYSSLYRNEVVLCVNKDSGSVTTNNSGKCPSGSSNVTTYTGTTTSISSTSSGATGASLKDSTSGLIPCKDSRNGMVSSYKSSCTGDYLVDVSDTDKLCRIGSSLYALTSCPGTSSPLDLTSYVVCVNLTNGYTNTRQGSCDNGYESVAGTSKNPVDSSDTVTCYVYGVQNTDSTYTLTKSTTKQSTGVYIGSISEKASNCSGSTKEDGNLGEVLSSSISSIKGGEGCKYRDTAASLGFLYVSNENGSFMCTNSTEKYETSKTEVASGKDCNYTASTGYSVDSNGTVKRFKCSDGKWSEVGTGYEDSDVAELYVRYEEITSGECKEGYTCKCSYTYYKAGTYTKTSTKVENEPYTIESTDKERECKSSSNYKELFNLQKVFADTTYTINTSDGIVKQLGAGAYIFEANGDQYLVQISDTDSDDKLIYLDANGSGVIDDGDINVSEDFETISVKTVAKTFSYTLKQGFNFVSFPFVFYDTDITSASSLLEYLNDTYGDSFLSLSKYESGKWTIVGANGGDYDNNDFQLLPGQGYVLKTSTDIYINLYGNEVTYDSSSDSAPIALSEGWNLIGLYGSSTKTYTAKTLLEGITNYTTVDFTAVNVSRWVENKASYEALQREEDTSGNVNIYGLDFPISDLKSYFVKITKGDGNWEPALNTD